MFNPAIRTYFSRLNVHLALLAAGATAMVVGLIEQVIALKHCQIPPASTKLGFAFARSFAVVWRIVFIVLIVVCLLGQVLLSRRILTLPERDGFIFYQLFPDKIFLIVVLFVLIDSLRRWRPSERRQQRWWIDACVCLFGLSLALFYVWPDTGLTVFLVHIATEGIESAQRYHRPGVFPNHQIEHFRTYWSSLAAAIAVMLAATFLARGKCTASANTQRYVYSALYLTLLGAAAGFCTWFYRNEFPRISPDMASVGLASNWFDWVSSSIVVAILVTAAAYRLSVEDFNNETCEVTSTNSASFVAFHESVLWLMLFFCSAVVFCFNNFRGLRTLFTAPSVLESLGYFLRSPESYLMMALAALTVHLCWVRWKRRHDLLAWKLRPVDRIKFGWSWLAVALLAIVALPTIAIYCFTFWLGPWQLYGP
jgi:hypothetical protein